MSARIAKNALLGDNAYFIRSKVETRIQLTSFLSSRIMNLSLLEKLINDFEIKGGEVGIFFPYLDAETVEEGIERNSGEGRKVDAFLMMRKQTAARTRSCIHFIRAGKRKIGENKFLEGVVVHGGRCSTAEWRPKAWELFLKNSCPLRHGYSVSHFAATSLIPPALA